MSHFSRTSNNKTTPQKNLNKSQQPTQASLAPSQMSSSTQQPPKGGYVYRPPVRIARTNVNTASTPVAKDAKVQEKIESKKVDQTHKQQKQAHQNTQTDNNTKKTTQSNLTRKPIVSPIVRKPAIETVKEQPSQVIIMNKTITVTTQIITSEEVTESKEEQTTIKQAPKPVVNKPVSRLTANRTNDPLAILGFAPPKKEKEQPAKIEKVEEPQKPITSPYSSKVKPTITIEEKPQTLSNSNTQKNPYQKLAHDSSNARSMPTLDLKKPAAFSYPKKISRRQKESQQTQQQTQQAKPQTSPANEETSRQQTPKFNRQPGVNEKSQPQMFSSSYSLQRKNANQSSQNSASQSSQSAANLKQIPNQNVTPTIDRVTQSQKPLTSVVQQSLSKSPLSHASRYSNKVETPAKEQKENTITESQVIKVPKKRSNLIGFALNRLYAQKMASNLLHLFSFAKNIKQSKDNIKHYSSFERSLCKFIKNFELNALVRASLHLMKTIYSKTVKNDMTKSTDPKVVNHLINNRSQCIGKILENILPSDSSVMKTNFSQLKSILLGEKIRQKKIQHGAKILTCVESKKMKENWQDLCEWSHVKHQVKLWKLTRCSDITNGFQKLLLRDSFTKLTLNKLKEVSLQLQSTLTKQPSKSTLNKAPQSSTIPTQHEDPSANKQLKQRVTQLQTKLSEAKERSSQQPKQSDLRKTLQQLKEEKEQASSQISTKKQRNQQLKERLDALMSRVSHEELSSLSQTKQQNEQPTLSLVHEIYMKTYKQPEPQCVSQENIQSLCAIHRVDENQSQRQTVSKWLAIQQNMNLKHEINLYEGNCAQEASSISGSGSLMNNRREAMRQLEEQNQIIKKFIRSYVKERYMWEEVKEYVAAVISE